MGFRDLKAFNLAILAKQEWRMIQESNSLLYWCFKARYSPQTSFLEAVESLNSTQVQSLLESGEWLLNLGSW